MSTLVDASIRLTLVIVCNFLLLHSPLIAQNSVEDQIGIFAKEAYKLFKERKYEDAIKAKQKCFALQSEHLGADHVDTVNSFDFIAAMHCSLKNFQEAEKLYALVLKIKEKQLEDDSSELIHPINNLATVLESSGKSKEAEELGLRALEVSRKSLGEDHLDEVWLLRNLGLRYQGQGKYKEAEKALLHGLKITEKSKRFGGLLRLSARV